MSGHPSLGSCQQARGERTTTGNITVANSGDIDLVFPLTTGSGETASLTSADGSVAQGSRAYITAGELEAYGDSTDGSTTSGAGTVSLDQTNTIGALYASANYGDVLLRGLSGPGAVQLLGLQASGTVIVSDQDGALETVGTIRGQIVTLAGDGFVTAGGTVTAPTVTMIDNDPNEAWTINPTTISTQGQALTYSQVANLYVSGGSTFNVTPSPSTAISIEATAGTLNYNAGGKPAVATKTPSGGVSQSGMQLVQYNGINKVNLENLGASPPPAVAGRPSHICKLRLSGTKIVTPKLVHDKPQGHATLTAIATCSHAEHLKLTGTISVLQQSKRGRAKYRTYRLATVRANAKPNTLTRITVRVPEAVETATKSKAKMRGSFSLDPTSGHAALIKITVQRLT